MRWISMLDLSGNELFDGFVDFSYQLLYQLTICTTSVFLIQLCSSSNLNRTHLCWTRQTLYLQVIMIRGLTS